jgi:deoxyribodipyrimidine photo-lyase
MNKATIFWFRRDLRLHDNVGLFYALSKSNTVYPIFIFDKDITNNLNKDDYRLNFIKEQIKFMNKKLKKHECSINIFYGKPLDVFKNIISKTKIERVVFNKDYEPYAIKRDDTVKELMTKNNIEILSYKDHVIYEENEVVKENGDPYVVYTPYSRKWISKFNDQEIVTYHSDEYLNNLKSLNKTLKINEIPFSSSLTPLDLNFNEDIIKNYERDRNFPAINATSKLGVHLRFGTKSVRELVLRSNFCENKTFLKELIWREFFIQILWHFPHTVNKCFKEKYENVEWINDNENFIKWCEGNTGYPIVDAGMRELNSTGFMHNRVRMITASFLCKHLLIDWRKGEKYFASKLFDYEQASNVGNWQWVAGCGVDAAPYFRIFNPIEQLKKFDKQKNYVRKWVPEYDSESYVDPIIDHKYARERCLNAYKTGLNK